MRNIKKKLLTFMMLMIIACSTLMIPAAECKAEEVCSHPSVYIKYTEHVDQWIDYHSFGQAQICYYQTDVYNAYFYCSICDTYLYYDTATTTIHTNPDCPY
jgi:hypothetical protein